MLVSKPMQRESKIQPIFGFAFLGIILFMGYNFLESGMLFFRLLMGLSLGYALSRAYTGFAGSINRAYTTGSTKLLRTLMFMFFITTLISTAFLFNADPTTFGLWINPINFGLLAGGALFGFGMSFSACCASGVLTDLVTALPRALVTLVFFGMGVFLGFPIQRSAEFVTATWFNSSTFETGVFLPDLFKWDGLNGYLGAILLTALFCGIVIFFSYKFESSRKRNNTYAGHFMETRQDEPDTFDSKEYSLFSNETYNRLFVRPWTLKQGAVAIALVFALLMGVTGSGWGASTPYGFWFGKVLMLFGVSAEALAEFTLGAPEHYSAPFFSHPVNTQNAGIFLGTIVFLLTANKFREAFMSEMSLSVRQFFLFALGGLSMGFGTRLANGCNVGALYTPIAQFSLSGWVFLAVMILGGIIGNKFAKVWFK
ncbi:YeeE/YedE family protein [Lacticigenium naphthae]|uniref:YeeE/YedE family protein n=1 Tax=Lacticigenium naphthae TaxID=515351 RepID=UPI0003F54219|nr:YeeE/YedE family protein [Lacticigenium naphthae]